MSLIAQDYNIGYDTELPPKLKTQQENGETLKCLVQLQRETPAGLIDAVCNGEVAEGHAGLCRYVLNYNLNALRNINSCL